MKHTTKTLLLALLIICIFMFAACEKDSAPDIPTTPTPDAVAVDEHIWVPANYQEPETCSHCGETQGEKLKPAFEESGAKINMEETETYEILALCEDEESYFTGEVSILQYHIQDGDEGYDTYWPREGYEYRTVFAIWKTNDDNAKNIGAIFRTGLLDYYSGNIFFEEDHGTINYYGEDIECRIIEKTLTFEWIEDMFIYEYEFTVHVPIGYDGFVLAHYNAEHGTKTVNDIVNVAESIDAINDDNTRFFRFIY